MANSYTSNYNLTKPEVGADTNAWGGHLNGNLDTIDSQMKTNADSATTANNTANGALQRSGGTMSGFITLHSNPTSNYNPATKLYCDTNFFPVAGGAINGYITLPSTAPTADYHTVPKIYVDTNYLSKTNTGSQTLAGPLLLSRDPQSGTEAATRSYVDGAVASGGGSFVPLNGITTMTGTLKTQTGAAVYIGANSTLSDRSVADTLFVEGRSNTASGYINFGQTTGNALGAITGGNLTWKGSPIVTQANFNTYGLSTAGNWATQAGVQFGGAVTLPDADPTANNHATRKSYVDARVLKAGDTMTGNLTIQSGANQMWITLGSSGGYFYGDASLAGWYKTGGGHVRWDVNTGNFNTNGSITGGALAVGAVTCTTINTQGNTITVGAIAASGAITSGAITSAAISCTTLNTNGNTLTTGTINAGAINGTTITASVDLVLSSDVRIKDDIRTITDALDLVGKMRGVSYVRKDTRKPSVGVIAQEIEQVIPAVVHTDENGYKAVAYANLVGVLIEAVKELSARLEKVEGR